MVLLSQALLALRKHPRRFIAMKAIDVSIMSKMSITCCLQMQKVRVCWYIIMTSTKIKANRGWSCQSATLAYPWSLWIAFQCPCRRSFRTRHTCTWCWMWYVFSLDISIGTYTLSRSCHVYLGDEQNVSCFRFHWYRYLSTFSWIYQAQELFIPTL